METTFDKLSQGERFTVVGVADDSVCVKVGPGEYQTIGGWIYKLSTRDRRDLRVRRVG